MRLPTPTRLRAARTAHAVRAAPRHEERAVDAGRRRQAGLDHALADVDDLGQGIAALVAQRVLHAVLPDPRESHVLGIDGEDERTPSIHAAGAQLRRSLRRIGREELERRLPCAIGPEGAQPRRRSSAVAAGPGDGAASIRVRADARSDAPRRVRG
ncbi:MAG: hypothetical protein ACK56I_32795, partial [bacterium]